MAKKIILFATIFLLNFNKAFCFESPWQKENSGGAAVQIIGSFYKNESAEKKLILGARFKIEKDWKIYGNDAGGIGLPPSFNFAESKNIKSFEAFWPEAKVEEEVIGEDKLKFLVYQNEVIIPLSLNLDEIKAKNPISLKIDYGLCKDICVPASAEFNFEIADEIDENSLQKIQEFYSLKISETKPEEFTKNTSNQTAKKILLMLAIAFLGGAILNIMPCVLPVLSIKLISIIKHSNASTAKIRFAFFATILGILSCFLAFAASASIIKISGNSFGWGLQFQNPYFLIFLITILTIFTANLLGFFEITYQGFLTNFLHKKINQNEVKKNIFIPNFLSGILAVLLATPCSAPFLGTAISFALSQNFAIIFTIFAAIGLGFSLPYFILLLTPKFINFLPKTGNWMNLVKKLMALFLAITVLWIANILAHNIGYKASASAILMAALLTVFFKIDSKIIKILAISFAISCHFLIPEFFSPRNEIKESQEIWQSFDEERIATEIALGKIVVIDITADWCITCKFNKARVLDQDEVIAKLNSDAIVAMRADITKPNPKILSFLHKHNRFAIPFNAVYGSNAPHGLVTSEILTKKELFEFIKNAK